MNNVEESKKRSFKETGPSYAASDETESRDTAPFEIARSVGGHRESDFFLRLFNDDSESKEHNYSITNRWRKRLAVWQEWKKSQEDELKFPVDRMDVEKLRLPPFLKKDLFLVDDDDSSNSNECSPLGRELARYERHFVERTNQIRMAKSSEAETNPLAKKFANYLIVSNSDNLLLEVKAVETFIRDIYERHRSLRNKFTFVKSKGNESVATVNSTKQQSIDSSRIDMTKVASPSDFDDIAPKTDANFRKKLILAVSEPMQRTLAVLQGFVYNIFQRAKEGDDGQRIGNTIKAILTWEKDSRVDETMEYGLPPTDEDRETTADHPILHAVICRIIRVLSTPDSDQDFLPLLHEHEYGVVTEQCIAAGYNERERRIDVTAQERQERLAVVLPAMVGMTFEIKTASHQNGKLAKSLEKARSQVMGHLGKQLMFSFDFGGVGQDSNALGAALTPWTIEVLEMSLSKVGTADVQLETVGTGVIPLLGAEYLRQRRTNDATVHVPIEDATAEKGFILLAGALIKAQRARSLPNLEHLRMDKEKVDIVRFLGSGAFSDAVQLKKEGDFMKIPRSAAFEQILEHEAGILQVLGQAEEGKSSIPRFVRSGSIQATIRDEISNMKCLHLNGIVGSPLSKLSRGIWNSYADPIVSDIFEALQFAHGKNVYHLDVRPGNIIVKGSSGERPVTMLSDWGCAAIESKQQRSLKTFRGCTPYAHDLFFGSKSAYPLNCELDYASLGYTLYHVEKGVLDWMYEFDRPSNVGQHDLEHRRNLMINFIYHDSPKWLPKAIKDTLQKACRCDVRRSSR